MIIHPGQSPPYFDVQLLLSVFFVSPNIALRYYIGTGIDSRRPLIYSTYQNPICKLFALQKYVAIQQLSNHSRVSLAD